MKQTIQDLLTSKKFLAALAAILVQVAGKLVGLDPSMVDKITAALLVYVIGQGVADNGKGAAVAVAKVQLAAAKDPAP